MCWYVLGAGGDMAVAVAVHGEDGWTWFKSLDERSPGLYRCLLSLDVSSPRIPSLMPFKIMAPPDADKMALRYYRAQSQLESLQLTGSKDKVMMYEVIRHRRKRTPAITLTQPPSTVLTNT